MRRIPLALLLGAILILSATVSRAASPTPVPDMKPNFSSMAMFLGTWTCHSVVRGAHRSDTSNTTMAYDGHWMQTHDVAPPFDKYRSRAITTDTWTTYNSTMHQWAQVAVDDFGGYFVSTSPGWRGNKLTYTSVVTPDGSSGYDTLTKLSATRTTDTFWGKDKSGKTMPPVTTICVKS
jgi:hypothetical protein